MGKDCCGAKEEALIQLRARQAKVLKLVLVLNAVMFLLEFTSGLLSRSTALLADSLDMFGDAAVYGFSLYVLNKTQRWRASAALLKGVIMLLFGLGVLSEAAFKLTTDLVPEAATMGAVGLLALLVNISCLALLMKHKEDDINMRSTWICSRNDIIANAGVLLAAGAVTLLQSRWPDVAIGTLIAALFLRSAFQVISEALAELKNKLEISS